MQELVASLARLPEQQRTALVMHELGGCSYAEVADALERDETAVRGLTARARLSLRAELRRASPPAPPCEELAHQPDGTAPSGGRPPAPARLRGMPGVRRRDALRCLPRGLAPPVGLGLVGLASLLLTRPLAVGAAVAGRSVRRARSRPWWPARCVTAAEGVRELVVEPAPGRRRAAR